MQTQVSLERTLDVVGLIAQANFLAIPLREGGFLGPTSDWNRKVLFHDRDPLKLEIGYLRSCHKVFRGFAREIEKQVGREEIQFGDGVYCVFSSDISWKGEVCGDKCSYFFNPSWFSERGHLPSWVILQALVQLPQLFSVE